jgi:ribonuclease HII
MDLSKLPLSELEARLRDARGEASLQRLARALRRDRRAGARALGRRCERRVAERRRLARLFRLRAQLHAEGLTWVAGVDEVGMGPLAGPVVAAAVVLPRAPDLPGLDDSKRLAPPARERLASAIREQALAVCVAAVPPAEVDRRNVYQAGLEAMRRSVQGLSRLPDHVSPTTCSSTGGRSRSSTCPRPGSWEATAAMGASRRPPSSPRCTATA